MDSQLTVNLGKIAKFTNASLPILTLSFLVAGYQYSFYFHFLTVAFFLLTLINFFYRHVQSTHSLLTNFGLIAQGRYLIESIGPELRQYLFTNDVEEEPFNRTERSEVYRKAKGLDATSAFGSQLQFDGSEYKLRHSLYPLDKEALQKFNLHFGEERSLKTGFTLTRPFLISAMSYGALGNHAVRALARGAKKTGLPMNTGEGGYPKYHLMENCDLIFQMGTAKFGVRHEDGSLDPHKLENLSKLPQVKMIEIKLSQGAKPGKGGLLPKEKITEEISQLRGVPMGQDVVSPPHHLECTDAESTVKFIARVQEISGLPVGIKLCFGRESEFFHLVEKMKQLSIHPDYISIDGAEGGTGAAPKSFMDDLGVPLFQALPKVHKILQDLGLRNKLKLLAAGKLINAGSQLMALSLGAQACYTARGFMLALGCIQAMQCNKNTCPVGITTHNSHLQKGLGIENKSERVKNYILGLEDDHYELLSALGKRTFSDLKESDLLFPL
ncbi:MAG: FMN-binding glutamate synthase family protein [Deltaproteobacteria bacterium]|nr:FMN-binding glutamate synthase family protein [Deltaproteobacteria bacterium]